MLRVSGKKYSLHTKTQHSTDTLTLLIIHTVLTQYILNFFLHSPHCVRHIKPVQFHLVAGIKTAPINFSSDHVNADMCFATKHLQ